MSQPWTLNSAVRRNTRAVWRAFGAEVAVISPGSGAIRTLNEVAGRVWDLADGRTFGDIVQLLAGEYEVDPAQLESDVRGLLEELDARDLLVRNE